jgi:glyoxylase-like metal-dependent hydrolase (beta-lactamase superfamily II)
MAEQIVPGIWELKVPIPNNPLENTNVYLLKRDGGYLLIDTGWNSDLALHALETELAAAGAAFAGIKEIVVTHAHFDHYGLVGKIKQLSGAKVYMHQRDEEIFRTRYAITDEFRRESEEWFYSNGVPRHEMSLIHMPFGAMRGMVPQKPDVHLHGGETITANSLSLQVIWTPGHSPGHICLYEAKHRLLFSGDHVLPVITPNISLPPRSDGNPLGDFVKSLETVRKLDVETVLPAHENVFHDLPKRVREIEEHHEIRSNEILKALESSPKTAYEVSAYITWMPEMGGVHFKDLMPGDQRAAVSETLAHLRAMTVDGRLKVLSKGGIFYYECAGASLK